MDESNAPGPLPDLSARPFHLTVETLMRASPARLFHAWTEELDRWIAVPGSVRVDAVVGGAFSFEIERDHDPFLDTRSGRFLRLERDRIVEMTWMTGAQATKGAETIVTVELEPQGAGTLLRLMHAGFPDQPSRDRYHQEWSVALDHLDRLLSRPSA
jgi:uncharacterized protein YndB with AHSA1/START domain